MEIFFQIYVATVNQCTIVCFSFNSKHQFTPHFSMFETINFVKSPVFLNFLKKCKMLPRLTLGGGRQANTPKTLLLKNDYEKKLLKRFRFNRYFKFSRKTQNEIWNQLAAPLRLGPLQILGGRYFSAMWGGNVFLKVISPPFWRGLGGKYRGFSPPFWRGLGGKFHVFPPHVGGKSRKF